MKTRIAAAEIMQKVLKGHSLAHILPPALARMKAKADAAFLQTLCFETCRWYYQLDALLGGLLDTPLKPKDQDIHILLILGLCQLSHLGVPHHAAVSETVAATPRKKPWARGLINAVLHRFLREKPALTHHAHPDWWAERLEKAWPAHVENILTADNTHPPLTLRVNRLQSTREEYLTQLADTDMAAYAIPETTSGICLEKPVPVSALPGFETGRASVQDAAAQLAAILLAPQPGERILDACAAPGGKTTHLLEQQPDLAELVAIDKEGKRLAKIRENLERLTLECTLIEADAGDPATWWDGRRFDRILLDAPCSASGVIRRHPDIRLLRRNADMDSLAATQSHLLDTLWPLLKPGGLLLYATCSVFPDENQAVIARFLAAHPDAHEKPIQATWGRACSVGRQILPGEHEMDGFYYAALQK